MTYTLEPVNRDDVQEPEEQFISHQDGHQQVTQHQRAQVVCGVFELPDSSHQDTDQVKSHHNGEELAVGVVPQLKQNPSADFSLWLRWWLAMRLLEIIAGGRGR